MTEGNPGLSIGRMICFHPAVAVRMLVILAMMLRGSCVLAAAPVVSNVRASQRAGSKVVDIYYDLADPDSATVRVSLQISSDGGTTWVVPAQTLVGTGFGDLVKPGNGRWIKWDAGVDWNGQVSDKIRFRVIANDDPVPAGMALIPAGNFAMGNSTDAAEGSSNELPVHTVYVSAFYVDRYLVTKQLWDDVRAWGLSNGYTDLPVGNGKAANHPVQAITWYAMVKWCNARSERDGLTPVYYTNDAQTVIYKTGSVDVTNAQVKWNANGYRLPTEAEWEKAARGGLSGQRFPWGATITHSQANYNSSSNYSYDVSPTRGYHPTFAVNGYPYTGPVGYFAPNGYGLYDMAGNVQEWCWDWFGSTYYSSSPSSDPQGPPDPQDPPQGPYRVIRGGNWYSAGGARGARVASRTSFWPNLSDFSFGCRSVRR